MTDKERLYELRKRVFRAIKEQLEEDPMCKSYEGAIEVGCEYPNFFEDAVAGRQRNGNRLHAL